MGLRSATSTVLEFDWWFVHEAQRESVFGFNEVPVSWFSIQEADFACELWKRFLVFPGPKWGTSRAIRFVSLVCKDRFPRFWAVVPHFPKEVIRGSFTNLEKRGVTSFFSEEFTKTQSMDGRNSEFS